MIKVIKEVYNKSKYILPSSTVLMFHHVTDKPTVKKSLLMKTNNFLSAIDSFNCYADLRSTVEEYREKRIAITFDDALLDVYTVAYRELSQRNIPFTVFVATDLLNQEGYVSTKELLEMSQNPLVNIGSHCVSHTPLRGKLLREQEKEMFDSKFALEDLLDREIKEIAFPFGQYDKNTITLLHKTKHYDYAFLASGGPVNSISAHHTMKLPRLRIDDAMFNRTMDLLKYAYR